MQVCILGHLLHSARALTNLGLSCRARTRGSSAVPRPNIRDNCSILHSRLASRYP